MKGKKVIVLVVVMLAAFSYLLLIGMKEGSMYYLEVSEYLARARELGNRKVRVNGRVVKESLDFNTKTLTLRFILKDTKGNESLPVDPDQHPIVSNPVDSAGHESADSAPATAAQRPAREGTQPGDGNRVQSTPQGCAHRRTAAGSGRPAPVADHHRHRHPARLPLRRRPAGAGRRDRRPRHPHSRRSAQLPQTRPPRGGSGHPVLRPQAEPGRQHRRRPVAEELPRCAGVRPAAASAGGIRAKTQPAAVAGGATITGDHAVTRN